MSQITYLEPTWREWVVSNVRRKCTRESMVGLMVEKDFDAEFANSVVLEVAKELESGGDVEGLEFTRRIEEIGRGVAVGRSDAAAEESWSRMRMSSAGCGASCGKKPTSSWWSSHSAAP